MIIGWAINSAMILMAAATFYRKGEGAVNDLSVAGNMLTPLLGKGASVIFALALLLAGISDIDWPAAVSGWVKPYFPENSMPVIMSVLGAVVMPHNLFLHSEVIQSRQWNLEEEEVIQKQLKYEFKDTLFP